MSLQNEIACVLNLFSAENGSDTPDFLLAEYLLDCLAAYDKAVKARDKWYGRGGEKRAGDALAGPGLSRVDQNTQAPSGAPPEGATLGR